MVGGTPLTGAVPSHLVAQDRRSGASGAAAILWSVAYYDNKKDILARLFGTTDIRVSSQELRVGTTSYPISDDVIVVLPEPSRPGAQTADNRTGPNHTTIAAQVQHTFGQEWQRFNKILPEQRREFDQYFDIVDLNGLANAVVCDFGAGMGRWSFHVARYCRSIILVDFSDAIHVARNNLRDHDSAVFVMGDITDLPFADDCCDFGMCIGVLHTLPQSPIQTIRSMRRYCPDLLVYLLYGLDNRPAYFQTVLSGVTLVRRAWRKFGTREFAGSSLRVSHMPCTCQ